MAINSGFFPLKMVIFHSYVSLPEGKQYGNMSNMQLPWRPMPNLIAAHPIVLRVMYQGLLGASWTWIAWSYDTSVW